MLCKLAKCLINTSDQMCVHLIKFRRGTGQFQKWDVCDVLSILKKEHFSILGWFGGVMMRGGCNDCAGSRPFLHINYRPVAANATHSVRHIHQTRLFEFDRRSLITKPKSMVKSYQVVQYKFSHISHILWLSFTIQYLLVRVICSDRSSCSDDAQLYMIIDHVYWIILRQFFWDFEYLCQYT